MILSTSSVNQSNKGIITGFEEALSMIYLGVRIKLCLSLNLFQYFGRGLVIVKFSTGFFFLCFICFQSV